MFKYNYVRIYNDQYGWLINNPTKLDIDGNIIPLSSEIKVVFPENNSYLLCVKNNCAIYFTNELLESEKTTLDNIVSTYQTINEG